MTPLPDGGWRTLKIKLSCLRDAGADMKHIDTPFTLKTKGRLSLDFTEIRLAVNDGDGVCPAGK
jgi:beta-glucosidase